MSTEFALPAELTIYTVNELLPLFKDWASHDADVLNIQAGAVSEIDAAGLQLLLSLAKTLAARDDRLALVDPSPALTQACEGLGVSGLVDWTLAGVAHEH
jgi:anti-anti-sigma regulatory factor